MRCRIRQRGGYENPRRGLKLAEGECFDAPDDLAVKLLRGGIAEPAPEAARETTERKRKTKTQAKTGRVMTTKNFMGEEA